MILYPIGGTEIKTLNPKPYIALVHQEESRLCRGPFGLPWFWER